MTNCNDTKRRVSRGHKVDKWISKKGDSNNDISLFKKSYIRFMYTRSSLPNIASVFLFWFPLGPEGCTKIRSGITDFRTFPNYMVDILVTCNSAAVIAICEA